MFYKKFIFLLFLSLSILEADSNESVAVSKSIWNNNNIWIKTYSKNRDYKTVINNLGKIEQKIRKAKNNRVLLEELNSRLVIQKSKLELYENNKSFDRLLLPFKFEIPEITIQEYIFQESKIKLNETINKYIILKNDFYIANSLLSNYLKNSQGKNGLVSEFDILYFNEFAENIDKTYFNLLEARDVLNERYKQFKKDRLEKHIETLIILIAAYVLYKILLYLFFYVEQKLRDKNRNQYQKILSILFFLLVFLFLVIRYLDNFLYIITFLSVLAAALTIALREVILNIVGSVFIFFSNMIRVGDRIMIQFETKHTIGDIADISLMKIKLNEIEDYTNVKEVKNVGRTIYIPNSYVFTKVFYNYSRKKDGLINDLIEFEFTPSSDFSEIEKITAEVFNEFAIEHTLNFTLNNLKTGIIGLISYQINYKQVSKTRGDISIKLLQAYTKAKGVELKSLKTPAKAKEEGE